MRAKKSLGQNFLISPRVAEAMVMTGDVKNEDIVIEIGPGKGALTEKILATGAQVIAIEKDRELVPILQEKFKKEISEKRFEVIEGDVLEKFSYADFFRARKSERSAQARENSAYENFSYKLIANIPYYVTGAIIEKFLSEENPPSIAVLMVQREVADRIMARDGKESILSISVKIFGTPSVAMKVSRGNFFPAPNVDSAVLKIEHIENPFTNKAEEEKFFHMVKTAFAHKRKKMLGNFPPEEKEKMARALSEIAISESARAEEISVDTWKKIFEKII